MTQAGETFVNPYTFVPFPESPPIRDEPKTHIANPNLLCGKLTVEITVKTAVLIQGFMTGKVHDVPRNAAGEVMIPGSSLKGAIRSLHETITGSCLRVFDGDFVPGYRKQKKQKVATAKERVDPGFHACTDWKALCPSCQVFGSADTTSNDTPHARQHSYRGHVRFSDAVATTKVKPNSFTRAPLSSPRPGAGEFYLVNDELTEGNVGDPPLREWGSLADQHTGKPRRLRGRKYYWHTPLESAPQPRRAKSREHHSAELTEEVRTIPAKTRLRATIVFDNLDKVQLGSLVAALQPSDLFSAPEGTEIWQHIGGGKPLGLGACRLRIVEEDSQIENVGARYGRPSDPVSVTITDLIHRFRDTMQEQQPDVVAIWPSLTKALASRSVPADRVWYPPGKGWKPGRTPQTSNEDTGFDFWKSRSGTDHTSSKSTRSKNTRRRGYPLKSLPHIDDDDQTMDVVADDAEITTVNMRPLSPKREDRS